MPEAIASRYATAFAHVASANGLDAAASLQQLRDFVATLAASGSLREVMGDPSIPSEQKLRVLDALSSRLNMPRQLRNLLAVIVDHGRLAALPEIVEAYAALADAGSGVTEVDIATAREIGDEERGALEQKAATLVGGPIRATYRQDQSLLGGAILTIGSTIYDGSLRGQLAGMKQRLGMAQA